MWRMLVFCVLACATGAPWQQQIKPLDGRTPDLPKSRIEKFSDLLPHLVARADDLRATRPEVAGLAVMGIDFHSPSPVPKHRER